MTLVFHIIEHAPLKPFKKASSRSKHHLFFICIYARASVCSSALLWERRQNKFGNYEKSPKIMLSQTHTHTHAPTYTKTYTHVRRNGGFSPIRNEMLGNDVEFIQTFISRWTWFEGLCRSPSMALTRPFLFGFNQYYLLSMCIFRWCSPTWNPNECALWKGHKWMCSGINHKMIETYTHPLFLISIIHRWFVLGAE